MQAQHLARMLSGSLAGCSQQTQPCSCRPAWHGQQRHKDLLNTEALRSSLPRAEHCRRRAPLPCRVTNGAAEMETEGIVLPEDADYIDVDQTQVFRPELGPLETRVELTAIEAMGLTKEGEGINLEETEYWFTEPEGGWKQEKKRLKKPEVVPSLPPTAGHPGEGRTQMGDLWPGQLVMGRVNRLMLYHGISVDIGAEYDALIPIDLDRWNDPAHKDVLTQHKIGDEVEMRIYRLVQHPRCRFPVIATPTKAEVAKHLRPVQEYEPVFDMSGLDLDEQREVTGRALRTDVSNFRLPDGREEMEDYKQLSELMAEDEGVDASATAYQGLTGAQMDTILNAVFS